MHKLTHFFKYLFRPIFIYRVDFYSPTDLFPFYNELGASSWELTAVIQANKAHHYIFKRQLGLIEKLTKYKRYKVNS